VNSANVQQDSELQDKEFSTSMQCELEPSKASHSKSNYSNSDMMPSSLSQIDTSILENLPDEVRADIFKSLPPHRVENQLPESSRSSVLSGSYSKWCEMLRVQNCSLSECLLSSASFRFLNLDPGSKERDAVVLHLCEFMKEYINQKVEVDLEELYNCFCLLKRYIFNNFARL
jgi:DNA repair protein REV1